MKNKYLKRTKQFYIKTLIVKHLTWSPDVSKNLNYFQEILNPINTDKKIGKKSFLKVLKLCICGNNVARASLGTPKLVS